MINKVTLVGRLTKDIELRKTNSNLSVASFTIAVDRHVKEKATDFINCVAWRQSAEYLSKYAHKGDFVGLAGELQTRTYDGQNGKVYVTEVVADTVSVYGGKREAKEEKSVLEQAYERKADDVDAMREQVRKDEQKYQESLFSGRPSDDARGFADYTLDVSPDDLPFY